MRKKITFLITSLALLLGSTTVWGQQGKGALLPESHKDGVTCTCGHDHGNGKSQNQWSPLQVVQEKWPLSPSNKSATTDELSLRRGQISNPTANPGKRDSIHGAQDVNLVFGAGESAGINNATVAWPASGGTLHTNSVLVGSDFSKNAVIGIYDNNGEIAGALRNVKLFDFGQGSQGSAAVQPPAACNSITRISVPEIKYNSSKDAGGPGPIVGGATNTSNPYYYPNSADPSVFGMAFYPYKETGTGEYVVVLWNHVTGFDTQGLFRFTAASANTLYTSTRDNAGMDDGKALTHSLSPSYGTPGAMDADYDNLLSNTDYIRPTTVSLAGQNTLNAITMGNVEWYAIYMKGAVDHVDNVGPFYAFDASGCVHYSGWACYDRDIMKFDSIRTKGSGRFVDAAVQLLEGARVCVSGNVMDQTGYINNLASADRTTYHETNAIIALPTKNRVTFRTAGNFKANMHHEASSASNVLYTAAAFPNPATDIYLYVGASTENLGQAMKNFANPQYTTVTTKAPYLGTTSSVFGVNGDYLFTGKMANIHTDSTTFNNSNKGVIEVGTLTSGKSHFYVYGNGMLKNYEGCNISANFPMYFGHTKGGTPQLKINSADTLYIVNFGNNGTNYCDADLLFHTTSVDSIKYAFTGQGAGALQIQALSDLRLRGNGTWNAAANGNNIYLLSDGGNISTQQLNISSDNMGGAGHGLITFWAETNPLTDACAGNSIANRFSKSGNIYLNDAVTLTRAAVATTQTNIIATNNIRTASITSTNTNNQDTTNIVSRMGDIYLGYSAGTPVYDASDNLMSNGLTGNGNIFSYKGTGTSGTLNILAGYDDQSNTARHGGGNIYFTHIDAAMTAAQAHITNITIPFSNEYTCAANNDSMLHKRSLNSMEHYEHAGIIGGVGRNGKDLAFANYAGLLEDAGTANDLNNIASKSLVYKGNDGDLTVDAGTLGNIIMNTGSSIDFQGDKGNGLFRTRYGDIDMRGETDATNLNGSLLFLASSNEANKWITGVCGCTEERNNVYLQDFQYTNGSTHNGSVFVGADNNIKLNYGGLTNQATQADPFLSKDYDARYNWGAPYKSDYHCDLNPAINQARNLTLNFSSVNGGFAAVAADRVDVYKQFIYTGGTGTGMSSVPGQGSLQGENVAGYGLYMKTTAAKNSWTFNGLEGGLPKCPFTCTPDDCGKAALHNIVRMTFHDDARIYANNQKVLLASPVIESYGHLELDVASNSGSKTSLTIQADSLIFHDSLILNETTTNKVIFQPWTSSLKNPIMKFGYKRTSPPVQEVIYDQNGKPFQCNTCVTHTKGDPKSKLDTMVVVFKNDASMARTATTIVDHTVMTFLTDSFDHVNKGLIRNAKIYTDLFKVRNQVEFWRNAPRTKDGHFELISEAQMFSKDYAGVYTRHLHMEPIGACGRRYSDLWLCDPALDVITTSTFGGYGTIHADVHVEIEAFLAPGYASLGLRGNCYEQKAGTLTMENLRLDKGAQLHYTIGDVIGFDGEYTDCIDAEEITMYGDVFISIEKRACEKYEPGCYPIIRYNTVAIGESNLNNLKLKTTSIDGMPLTLNTATPGVVYLCVGNGAIPTITREVHIPQTPGVTLISPAQYGNHYIGSYGNFNFTVKYDKEPPLKVTTNRTVNGVTEELVGTKNANGEYEYVIRRVQQNIVLQFGPDYATDNVEIVDGKAIWSYGSTIYIRVEKDDIASIYSIAGQLVKQVELTEGSTSIPMTRGVYIITLKDGSVHKVILK